MTADKKPIIAEWSLQETTPVVESFLRRPAFEPAAEAAASLWLARIREQGAPAVLAAAAEFDKAQLLESELAVTAAEFKAATQAVPLSVRRALKEAHARIKLYAAAGLREPWHMQTAHGGTLGECFSPMQRIGAYVPGGTAPLVSTALMTVALAQVAGVREIVACTPCAPDKSVNPALLYALKLAGATEVYRVGGIQAIGLMAFGSAGITPVEKIVGPGNAYVTAAKRQVYGYVAIDQVAGPSEIAVLADNSASPAWIAADLLSQIEHGSGLEKALLATNSRTLAEAVSHELLQQAGKLARGAMVERVLQAGGVLLAVTPSIAQGLELVNRFAPEHFEIMTREPRLHLNGVRAAGAVFIGPWTPEPVGDFVAGPSHVLPTGGAARMFNGLTADDFRRRHSFVEYTRDDLQETLPTIGIMAEVEGLAAHGRSAAIRFEAATR